MVSVKSWFSLSSTNFNLNLFLSEYASHGLYSAGKSVETKCNTPNISFFTNYFDKLCSFYKKNTLNYFIKDIEEFNI